MDDSTNRKFKAAVLITSDRAYEGIRPDATGPELKRYLESIGYPVDFLEIVPDDKDAIVAVLRKWIESDKISLVVISGGTGLSPRDVTPEATLEIIERRIPGMEEAMRQASFKIHPHAILSRAVVGHAGASLIITLPGSPKGALENLEVVQPAIEHALQLISGEKPDK
jgi:molybdenum cofactor synthesis domain-containing protein